MNTITDNEETTQQSFKSLLESTTAFYLQKKMARAACLQDLSQGNIETAKKLKEASKAFGTHLSFVHARNEGKKKSLSCKMVLAGSCQNER